MFSQEPSIYTIWKAKQADYFWLQSNAPLAWELFTECPDLVDGNYIVVPTFDGCSLTAIKTQPNDQRWLDIGSPSVIAAASEIPWSGNGEEIFFFVNSPDDETVDAIESNDTAMLERMDAGQSKNRDCFWKMLSKANPESYVAGGTYFFFATQNEVQFNKFMACESVKHLPFRREQEMQRQKQLELQGLGPECGPEICAAIGCERLRIKLGINCAEHHLRMLEQTHSPYDD